MRKIIIDFDNTFTVRGRDIDDFLAFIYLYEKEDVYIPFCTTTFGNHELKIVNDSTIEVFKKYGIETPVYFGADIDEKPGIAAKKIASYIMDNKDQVEILALGSLKNIKDAISLEPRITKYAKSFTAMGGITSPLYFKDKIMNELNFSIDHLASSIVLNNMPLPNIITGNNCMDHILLKEAVKSISFKKYPSLKDIILEWIDSFYEEYHFNGVVEWDLIAALYLYEKDLFIDEIDAYNISISNLKTGFLSRENGTKYLNLPKLKEPLDYKRALSHL